MKNYIKITIIFVMIFVISVGTTGYISASSRKGWAASYPEYIATKQDYINVLQIPEFRERAIAELEALANESSECEMTINSDMVEKVNKGEKVNVNGKDLNKETVLQRIVSDGRFETTDYYIKLPVEIPTYKRKGFESLEDVRKLMEEYNSR